MKSINYICTQDDIDKRLDFLLKSLLPEYGTRAVKRLCEQRLVFINQKPARAQYKIKQNDKLVIRQDNIIIKETIHILAENKDFLAVYKKPFLHSESHKGKKTISAELLVQEQINPNVVLLNRLDFATSGILLFAKENNAVSIERYKKQQENKQIEKKYFALTEGIVTTPFTINNKIVTENYKNVRVINESGNRTTKIQPFAVNEKDNASLLDCTIYQGARHQIRAHLSHMGFPLTGDKKYGAATNDFSVLSNLVPLQKRENPSPALAASNLECCISLNDYAQNEESFCLHHYALISQEFSVFCYPPYFNALPETVQEEIKALQGIFQ